MRGLNCGSGQRRFDTSKGWVNLDVTVRRPGQVPDVCAEGGCLPMADNSFDCVVLHHVLEHFGCGEAAGLIREAYRVLRTGGSLYIFVPDLRALAIRWITGKLDTQIYITNLYGAYQGEEGDRHRWGFTADSLRSHLLEQCRWEHIRHIRVPPTTPGMNVCFDWWILAMEFIK